MKKLFLLIVLAFAGCNWATAQRFTDALGRGLVAVPTGASGSSTTNFVSWRRLADEYYGVTYNLYKNGTLYRSNLTTTSYSDGSSATSATRYEVAAVVNGVEQAKCAAVTPWKQYVYNLVERCATGYLDIALAAVYDRNGTDVTDHYEPNDAELADLDGDGELEIIIKRLNTTDATGINTGEKDGKGNVIYNIYPKNSKEFVVLDAYKVNWQTGAASLMWRIDCGPNMVSANSTEINIIAYDWDEDGKAEVALRGADNMIVYGSDGKTKLYTIGNMNANTRQTWYSSRKSDGASTGSMAYTNSGAEYLIYMNGETGALYQQMTYPLKRLESNETDLNAAWGDSYGHRSSKYFMGAPFLDGRKASLFLGRGIYTRHKMIAMDLDRSTHKWSTRWTWNCNNKNSPWYGNGYHNFMIADVDEDGRDEIVYGSMVIDDNGKGLSTTGYEHGDAQHCTDFDPYRKGLEFFGCLENSPYYGCNYRDATTSEVLYKFTGTGDTGRALMANFSDSYPGSLGRSSSSDIISSVTCTEVSGLGGDSYIAWGDLNNRIYFDGDLCSEILNSPGTAREAKIEKPGKGRLFTSSGCNMNNDSKNNPCFQGDIIGDWREEIVVRCGKGLRVYTTGYSTTFTLPCLWYDHQYRQAMVWQMFAYNQPPHLSYFLGKLEGITIAPPPLTMTGRTEIAKDGTIGTDLNGKHALICDNVSTASSFTVAEGAQPAVITVNTPTWVQGTDVNGTSGTKVRTGSTGVRNLPAIDVKTYTHTMKGAPLSGTTQLVKQGDGVLRLHNAVHTHSGKTDVWGGTLSFNGTLQNSALWLNRFTTLTSDGGSFMGGITADYGATIIPGGENKVGTLTTTTLTLNHGARLLIDVNSDNTSDCINATRLVIGTKTGSAWANYGPKYLKPVIEIVSNGTQSDACYDLGAIGGISGSINNIILEGVDDARLVYQDGHLYLLIGDATVVTSISDTAADMQQQEPEVFFTPAGIRTSRPTKGLYISNRRKYVVK